MVLDVSVGKEALDSLKKSLLAMPKPSPERSGKSNAILPGPAYASQREESAPEPDEDDE